MALIFLDMHSYASSVRIRLTIYEMKLLRFTFYHQNKAPNDNCTLDLKALLCFVPSWLNYNSFSF